VQIIFFKKKKRERERERERGAWREKNKAVWKTMRKEEERHFL